jgi:PAS domain S-box-containing protein
MSLKSSANRLKYEQCGENKLLYALNAAAASLQQAAHSEQDVFRAVRDQIDQLGLRGGLSLLDEDGEQLTVCAFAGLGRLFAKLEKLTGFRTEGFQINLSQVDIYHEVIETGATVYTADSGKVISQMIPETARRFTKRIIRTLGAKPAIFSPLIADGRVRGVLNVVGKDLTADDAPAMEAFANHISIALDNARLFAAMQEEIAERRQAESALLASESKFRMIVEQSVDGVVLMDDRGIIVEWNEGLDRITGLTRKETIGKYIWDVQFGFAPDHKRTADFYEEVQTSITGFLEKGETNWMNQPIQILLKRKDGEMRTVQVITFPVKTETEFMICSVVRDNTPQIELKDALQKRAEEISVLNAISLDITTLHDFPTMLNNIVERAAELLEATGGALYLCDPGCQQVRLQVELYPNLADYTGVALNYGEGAAGKVAQSGEPLIIDDYRTWPGRAQIYEQTQPYQAVLSVPMIWHGEIVGVLQVMDKGGNRQFTQYDTDLLSLFARQAAVTYENARLLEAEGKRAAELEAVRQASLGLTASLELPEVLDAILQSVLDLLPDVQNGHIFLYNAEDGSQLKFGAAMWAEGPKEEPWSNPRSNGLTYTVAQSGETIVVADMSSHPLYEDAPAHWEGAIIGLPLKIGRRVVGVMNVSYNRPRKFEQGELRLLGLLGDQAAIAIENANLYEQAATERRHMSLLYDVSRELASSLDADVILDRAITLTSQALNGLVGEAFLYNPEDNRLSMRAIFGRSGLSLSELNEKILVMPGVGLAGWVAQHHQPVYVPDLSDDDRWFSVDGVDDDVKSAISAPILAGDKLLGVLTVLHSVCAAFSPDQMGLLKTISQEVGLALSNATRYQQIQRRLAEITLIQNLAQTFSQRLEVQVLLDEVVSQLANEFGYPQVEIFLVEDEFLIQRAYRGVAPEWHRLTFDQGIVGRVARTGEVAFVPDVNLDPDYRICYENIVAELAVPIFNGCLVVGVINIETGQRGQLTSQDRDLLQLLAGQISIALENAVLYERVRSHAEELENTIAQRTAELVELYELSQEIGYTLTYEDLLRLLLNHLRSAIRSQLVAGGIFYNGTQTLLIESTQSLSPSAMKTLQTYWSASVYQDGGYILDFENMPLEMITTTNPLKDVKLERIAYLIHAPIYADGRMAGVLIAGGGDAGVYEEEHERLLYTFANQAGTAIQRLAVILKAEQRRLESLIEHLPVGVLLLDAEFQFLVANPVARTILRTLNGGDIDGKLSRLGSCEIEELVNHQKDMIPVEITLDERPRRIFEVQAQPVDDDNRQWVLILREVTQERENQERIQMQDRLATVGQLAAGISHDFNNIMAAILVYTDLLINDPDIPANSKERLNIIHQQVQRSASLIRQILDFSRRSVMEQSTLDLLPFVKELDKILGRVIPENIQIELSYRQGRYLVHADPTRLQQVFMNLAVNARDAMPDGGRLHFELNTVDLQPGEPPPIIDMPSGRWIRIAISDNGIGIPQDNLPHIYEPFFTTKPVGQGTGLGLAQVYGIIKQHDGFIEVDSLLGSGTTFYIYLPAIPDVEDELDTDEPVLEFDGVGATVLLVEDNVTTLEALRALMEAHNYRVLTASDGEQALDCIKREGKSITLVVSDVVMPKMGGVALYQNLRERWPWVKMLFITGHPLEGRNQELLEKGDVHWLQKPFSVYDFSLAMNKLLSESQYVE